MIERSSENTEIAKLQRNAADFGALAAIVCNASDMAALGQKLITMADQITEAVGALEGRTGHSVEDICVVLAEGRA
jgi:hypothetical protein